MHGEFLVRQSFPQGPNCVCSSRESVSTIPEASAFVSTLIIAVGSTRKPKLAAVREAVDGMVDLLAAEIAIEIVGVEVESRVNHTPLSREESMRGARQRAESLQEMAQQEAKPWNYFVGLEGGLDSSLRER